VKSVSYRWAKPAVNTALVLALLSILAACTLPRVGPNKREIFAGSVQQEGDAFVVSVNDRVTRATAVVPALGFSGSFQNAATLTSDTIRPGDVLGLTIWENVDDGLLAGEAQNSTLLEEVQVDSAGSIFVPTPVGYGPRATHPNSCAKPSQPGSKNKHRTRRSRCDGWPGTARPSAWSAELACRAFIRLNVRPAPCRQCWPRPVASSSNPRLLR